MKALLAAGGTAGHINPALSIAKEIMKQEPDSEIWFIGREDGMEAKIVPQNGFGFHPIEIHGFERSWKWEDILFNLHSLWCAFTATFKTAKFLRKFRPDIVIGCGGYVSGPVVRAAAMRGYPTVIQEQNSFPGLTTKMLARRAKVIFVPNTDALDRIGRPEKSVVVGNPVDDAFHQTDREQARQELGVGDRKCIVSFGGSLGAKTVNSIAACLFEQAAGSDEFFFIHGSGVYDDQTFLKELEEKQVSLSDVPCRVSTYINDMPRCFAAADLVVCRCGATTLAEVEASGLASYLIPSPFVAENHQYYNGMTLVSRGAAILEEEKDLVSEKSAAAILALARDDERLKAMGEAALSSANYDTAATIYSHIKKLLG